ncbi:hypothetical protein WJX72_010288 [[Myrmecia] bisecta]|uniref:DUF711 family protein n=1 Tax=[Myrmecia] bisecta TaxID=41462 RepID=A0AAW1R8U9_9CHLO
MSEPLGLRIRTITYFLPLHSTDREVWAGELCAAGTFLQAASLAFTTEGYTLQTTRVATSPLADICPPADLLQAALDLQKLAMAHGIQLISIGPTKQAELLPVLTDIVAQTTIVSCMFALSSAFATADTKAAAEAVLRVAEETTAEGNFRFGVAANCLPGIPFFPVAYANAHASPPAFAIGTENTAILRTAFEAAKGDMCAAEAQLRQHLTAALQPVERIAEQLAAMSAVEYRGIDASLAPGLDTPSMTGSYDCLGLGGFGSAGTLAISALITGVLKSLPLKLCGYSGLMLPVCEDTGLAELASQGAFRISDLLQYSAVCGCGLDTVPVPGLQPGNFAANQQLVSHITALLLDVTALAFRLNKPLSCRLLPIPGKTSGQMTEFANPYLVNCKIMGIP